VGSNGTTAGTFLVRDIMPGSSGSALDFLTNVGGTLFFAADDGTHTFRQTTSPSSLPP
jgi:hypothetical protein